MIAGVSSTPFTNYNHVISNPRLSNGLSLLPVFVLEFLMILLLPLGRYGHRWSWHPQQPIDTLLFQHVQHIVPSLFRSSSTSSSHSSLVAISASMLLIDLQVISWDLSSHPSFVRILGVWISQPWSSPKYFRFVVQTFINFCHLLFLLERSKYLSK